MNQEEDRQRLQPDLLPSRRLAGGTDENQERCQHNQSIYWPMFEPGNSRMKIKSVKA
jgi:hypothetical protein